MLYVHVRDLDHVYEVAMRLLFFLTPIIYSPDFLSPGVRRLAMLNPLAHLIEYARGIILQGRVPGAAAFLLFASGTLVVSWFAVVIFRRAEQALVERV
jgi:ABC-type polysaccharide/polyol phosphate export permease